MHDTIPFIQQDQISAKASPPCSVGGVRGCSLRIFYPYLGSLQVLPPRVRVDLRVVVIKG